MASKRTLRAITSIAAAGVLAASLAIALTGNASAAPHQDAAPPACTPGTQVQTADGPVCGLTANGITSYLGLPYAAPPLGNLRWQSPHPATPWTATRVATQAGDICSSPGDSGTVGNEDCLNLNVQVPADVHRGERLPVFVEIHGGGFLITFPGRLPDGTNLVKSGRVVFVAIEYRTGILGFLAHAALGAHSGDWGLQDQQAALRWVQRNIARFGGNPHDVTISGASAGGASACAAAVSPTARDLFQKGISRSGFYNSGVGPNQVWQAADCKSQVKTEAQAQQSGASFAAKVGCGSASDVAACLRALPAATLVESAAQTLAPDAGGTIAPTINGTTLPMSPARAFATGHVNDVSLIIGADRDEINGGVAAPSVVATTPAQYRSLVHAKYGPLADAVLRLYPLSRFPTPSAFLAYRTLVADADSVCPALTAFGQLSRHGVPTYAYEVDDGASPVSYLGAELPWGAYHGAGGPSDGSGLDANHKALAAQVTAEWTGCARTGSPTVAGAPAWPHYTRHGQLVMSLMPGGDSALVPTSTLAMQHHCGFWDAVTEPVRH